ncbi:PASTA domain-containing protein [Spirochaetia bacterium]|nr:PASTA domain-containing protein [Spirochaetia bacterium]
MTFPRINLKAMEDHVTGHTRLFITTTFGLVVFVGVVALVVFFFALRGAEQAMVPDVQHKDLIQALLELQEKELYPRIQMRFSQTAEGRGTVLEQNPRPGTIVKAGRRIRLVVSQGAVVNSVEDYRGRSLEEVRLDLKTLFAAASLPLITIKEPAMYEFSSETPGTVLQQSPEPGSPVAGPVTLEFVVSRGPLHTQTPAPDLTGLSPQAALKKLAPLGLGFQFSLRPASGNEKPGMVVEQDPAKNTMVESDKAVNLVIASPLESKNGDVFGLFTYTMPENPYPLPVRLETLPPGGGSAGGERTLLAETDFAGGTFTFPYQLPPDSTLILSMLNRELYREKVQIRMEALSLDEL